MKYTLKLTEEQLFLIDRAIGEMPHRLAAPLIAAINEQLIEQRKDKTQEK